MSIWKLIHRSLTHHWRINFAVALGVAAATAVLTGALLVGDSVRGSLRALTLDRLGRIDEVLVTDRFFRQELADQLANTAEFQQYYDRATSAILFPHATVERQGERVARASGVLVVGCGADFWELDDGVRPSTLPGEDEIVVNQTLADDLRAEIGDQIVVRLPRSNQVPADSPLAHKSGRVRGVPGLKIVDIIPAEGLGRFSLRASQSLPRNVYVSLGTIQDALDQDNRVNALLIAGQPGKPPPGKEASQVLAGSLRPSLEDFGFSIQRVRRTFEDPGSAQQSVVFDYFSVTTDRMVFSPKAEAAAERAFSGGLLEKNVDSVGGRRDSQQAGGFRIGAKVQGQAVLTYFANTIAGGRDADQPERTGIPYSMISAIDFTEQFALKSTDGELIEPLDDDEIVLNSWAAKDRNLQPGDTVRVDYFEPETTHGEPVEASATFKIKAITPLTEPAIFNKPPTLANDPDFTPQVAGVTDQESIEDWDPPFPFDRRRVLDQDEDFWYEHRTTPKAFVSLAAGQKLWGSRFGKLTSYRIPAAEGVTEAALQQGFLDELRHDAPALGFKFIPVKRQQLTASSGATPFDVLFLSLSFFIIAAALMLVALLFRLGVEQRAAEVGILLASGLRRRKVAWLLVGEGLLVAASGGVLGVLVGVGYAWLMLAGLRTWWVGAITTPFLQFHFTPRSLVLGYLLGVVVSLLTIAWSVRQTRRIGIRRLLAGQVSDGGSFVRRPLRSLKLIAAVLVLSAMGLSALATTQVGMAQGGAFVGAGAALLTGLLLLVWGRLRHDETSSVVGFGLKWALVRLATRNAARNPSRSVTTIGLMATASFLVVALSSFRLPPTQAGAGGFDWLAESSEPLFGLNTPAGRAELLADDAGLLEGSDVFGLRLRAGDDASCNNLYRPGQPRVLGVTSDFIDYFDADQRKSPQESFAWTVTDARSDAQRANPWRLLTVDGEDDAIPVVIDMNTAMYSLGLLPLAGSIYEATYDGVPLRFRVVGLLENSVLQGNLVISEHDFKQNFTDVDGYRYFLIRSARGQEERVKQVLEDRLSDQGFDAISTQVVLQQLLAVQNTYLDTFQSLGALGLLFGTFGLATVQMRNVLERRGELALMRAAGFRRRRLAKMVLLENVLLLSVGLGTGVVAALLAVLPHKLLGNSLIPLSLLGELAVMLAVVYVVGVLSSLTTVRVALRTPVLSALRGD